MRKAPLFVLLTLLLATGCSRLKMAYELAPWYLEKQVKASLPDLDKGQAARLKHDIQAYVHWHQREMLPAYTDALRMLAEGLSPTANVSATGQRLAGPLLSGLYAQTVEPLVKPSAALLSSLSPQQISAWRLKLDEKLEGQRKLYLSDPEAAFQRRLKRLRGYLEDYAGKLNDAQVRQLETLSRAFVIPTQAWLDNKAERQAELLRLLSEKRSVGVIQAQLRDWWLSPRSGGEWRETWQWDEKAEAKYVRDLLELLTPEQKKHLADKLKSMAAELDSIVPSPEPQPKPGPSPQPLYP